MAQEPLLTLLSGLDGKADEMKADMPGWYPARLVPLLKRLLTALEGSDHDSHRTVTQQTNLLYRLLRDEAAFRPWVAAVLSPLGIDEHDAARAMVDFNSLAKSERLSDGARGECRVLTRRLLDIFSDQGRAETAAPPSVGQRAPN